MSEPEFCAAGAILDDAALQLQPRPAILLFLREPRVELCLSASVILLSSSLRRRPRRSQRFITLGLMTLSGSSAQNFSSAELLQRLLALPALLAQVRPEEGDAVQQFLRSS